MTNTQFDKFMRELQAIRAVLERNEATANGDPAPEMIRPIVAVTEFVVPPQPAVSSPAVRKHKGRRS